MLLIFLTVLPRLDAILDRVTQNPTYSIIYSPLLVNCTNPICEGPLANIYCFGEIISTAYSLGVNRECPGTRLLSPPDEVLENFAKLEYPIDQPKFLSFCRKSFDSAYFLEYFTPTDWTPSPDCLKQIVDPKFRKLVNVINERWKNLTRKFNADVLKRPSHYPVIPVKNPFVVPGGFFEVYYYWDTYWINKGLLLSGMYDTVKGIIDNYAYLVDTLGYIPNGGYIYLQKRSQPPMFVQMIDDYYTFTKDLKSVERWLPSMDKEMEFWMIKRAIQEGDIKGMYVYQVVSDCPRPENFMADYYLGMKSGRPKETWRAIASACESGWDFSTRWFSDLGPDAFEKYSIRTDRIVPVDLNVFMARNFEAMSRFKKLLGDEKLSTLYEKMSDKLGSLIHQYMWNHTAGVWFDLHRDLLTHRTHFYPSNVYPLLLKHNRPDTSDKILSYLLKEKVLDFPGGIPSSIFFGAHEQWDFPNVWAPNQHLFILSLWNTDHPRLIEEANKQALKFIDNAYRGLFQPAEGQERGLWEKYNATRSDGSPGGGGEYPVQEGFGWTNGALIDLMYRISIKHTTSTRSLNEKLEVSMAGGSPHIYIIGGLLAFLISVAITYTLRGISNIMSRYGHLSEEDTQSLLSYEA